MLVLTDEDVRQLGDMRLALDVIRQACIDHSAGLTEIPERPELRLPQNRGVSLFMPGYLDTGDVLGLKVVSSFPRNRRRGIPVTVGILLLFDPETGIAVATIDATYLTALRTGALTGVAVRRLAPPSPARAAVLGAGTLAPSQVDALVTALDLDEIRVWSRRAEPRQQVVAAALSAVPDHAVTIRAVAEAEEAVSGADIIVTCTSAARPIIKTEWVESCALICAMGGFTPDMQELPAELVGRAGRVVVDSRAGVVNQAGDIVHPVANGLLDPASIVELGEVEAGRALGRTRRDEVVVFKSCGFAALDLALGSRLVQRAREVGRGIEVSFSPSRTASD